MERALRARRGTRAQLTSDGAKPFYRQWLEWGWVVHAHARSVAPGMPGNPAMRGADGRPGRAIQYPFVEPSPGEFHRPWREEDLAVWKSALRDMLAWRQAQPGRAPGQISCEFIPFPDYGGGARYDIWRNNIACARWLREEWERLCSKASLA